MQFYVLIIDFLFQLNYVIHLAELPLSFKDYEEFADALKNKDINFATIITNSILESIKKNSKGQMKRITSTNRFFVIFIFIICCK